MIFKNKKLNISFYVIISGVILGFTNLYFNNLLGWVSYVGLFYCIIKYKLNIIQSICAGLGAATIQGLIVFGWMGELAYKYSGGQTKYGVLYSLIIAIIFAFKTVIPFAIFSILFIRQNISKNLFISVIGTASAFVITDNLYAYIFDELPWIYHFLGNTQSTNLYTAQLTEIAGIGGITFILIICNIFIAYAIYLKSLKLVFTTFLIIAALHLYGLIRISYLNNDKDKKINIALICDNTKPENRWNEKYLNEYVQTLFELNLKALKSNPDMVIWNEGVIPWSYQKDDDFLREIIKQTNKTKSHQLISYFSDNVDGSSYNSAYLFNNVGEIEGRYDKNKLLGGMEKPLWNNASLQLPFFNMNCTNKLKNGKSIKPIETLKIGKIGVMICNESLNEVPAAKLAEQGAGFIVLMANDNWFANTKLILHHFYLTRMRAIENRKDIVVNANMGYCGVISSTGEIKLKSIEKTPQVLISNVETNTNKSNFLIRKIIFNIFSIMILLFAIIKSKAYEKI